MDPLITNRIDAALLAFWKGGARNDNERRQLSRRKRPALPENPVEEQRQVEPEPDPDTPKHALDDLA